MSDIEDIREDFREMRILMHNYFRETDGRFGEMGTRLEVVGEGMGQLSREMVSMARRLDQHGLQIAQLAADLKTVAANSEERWNQLAGRARLQEDRFTRILEGADTRELYSRLEERVSRLEQRLDPPAA